MRWKGYPLLADGRLRRKVQRYLLFVALDERIIDNYLSALKVKSEGHLAISGV